jgi:hypothetical protein
VVVVVAPGGSDVLVVVLVPETHRQIVVLHTCPAPQPATPSHGSLRVESTMPSPQRGAVNRVSTPARLPITRPRMKPQPGSTVAFSRTFPWKPVHDGNNARTFVFFLPLSFAGTAAQTVPMRI